MKNTLLLSSTKFLIDNPHLMFDKPLEQMRMAYITTASKGATNLDYMERAKNIFATNKYNYEELDIEGKDEKWLSEYLKGFDVVYVQGGNTYYLLRAIRESGFDKAIKKLLPQGLIYIGTSAGSDAACPTIEIMGWKRPNDYNRFGVTDLTRMNIVPLMLSVHYEPEYRELLRKKIKNSKIPVRILTDDQAILVKDEDYQLVGKGEEVKL